MALELTATPVRGNGVTTQVVTFPSAPTEGHLIVLWSTSTGAFPTCTGFNADISSDGNPNNTCARILTKIAGASEGTTYTLDWGATSVDCVAGGVTESGIEPTSYLDQVIAADSGTSSVSSQSTGTTPGATSQADEIAYAISGRNDTNATTFTATNSFTLVHERDGGTGINASGALFRKVLTATGTQETTISNGAGGTSRSSAALATYKVASSTDRIGRVSWAELEVPTAPRVGRVSWAELEVPNAPRIGQISFAELEVPTAPRVGQVSWAELEIPTAPRLGQISWAEVEIPNAPRIGQISWAELEVPSLDASRIGQVSWAEMEVPTAPRIGQISWAELEAPNAPRIGQISWVELEVPTAPRVGQISFAEMEVPTAPRIGLISFAEFEVPFAPRIGQISFAEFEIPEFDREGFISWVEFEVPDVGGPGFVVIEGRKWFYAPPNRKQRNRKREWPVPARTLTRQNTRKRGVVRKWDGSQF